MPRRTTIKDKREKRKDNRDASVAVTKKRGRPKKIVEPMVDEKMSKRRARPKKIAAPATDVIQEVELIHEPKTEQSERVILKHFSEEEIVAEFKRKRIMWASVAFVAVLIMFVWVANIKRIVGVDASGSGSTIRVEDFIRNFSQNFKQINTGINQLKNEVASTSATNADAATTSETYDTNVEEINRELRELINNASTTINNN